MCNRDEPCAGWQNVAICRKMSQNCRNCACNHCNQTMLPQGSLMPPYRSPEGNVIETHDHDGEFKEW
jgi:hypothetical protein